MVSISMIKVHKEKKNESDARNPGKEIEENVWRTKTAPHAPQVPSRQDRGLLDQIVVAPGVVHDHRTQVWGQPSTDARASIIEEATLKINLGQKILECFDDCCTVVENKYVIASLVHGLGNVTAGCLLDHRSADKLETFSSNPRFSPNDQRAAGSKEGTTLYRAAFSVSTPGVKDLNVAEIKSENREGFSVTGFIAVSRVTTEDIPGTCPIQYPVVQDYHDPIKDSQENPRQQPSSKIPCLLNLFDGLRSVQASNWKSRGSHESNETSYESELLSGGGSTPLQ
ncbi:hypothetical protein RRG08_037647 [Elysia crispata]|uniref:Uncharacterized protein n=1 Tax=Elysia crispata TaxID=231223 RepID=A0AAE0YGV5_9GAST|nr:hypothetical protein RRG08_037647 [Elysia crispata]